MLQAMGLIDSRVGNGTFARGQLTVTPLASVLYGHSGTLGEQLELRRVIEPQVARLAAERATDSDIDEIFNWLRLQEAKLSSGLSFVDEDSAMHLAIARASRNSLLVKMIEGIHELLLPSRVQSLRTQAGNKRSLEGHTRICEAIRSRDGEAAYKAMLAHVVDVEHLIHPK